MALDLRQQELETERAQGAEARREVERQQRRALDEEERAAEMERHLRQVESLMSQLREEVGKPEHQTEPQHHSQPGRPGQHQQGGLAQPQQDRMKHLMSMGRPREGSPAGTTGDPGAVPPAVGARVRIRCEDDTGRSTGWLHGSVRRVEAILDPSLHLAGSSVPTASHLLRVLCDGEEEEEDVLWPDQGFELAG